MTRGRGKHGLEGDTVPRQSKYGLCLNTNDFELTAQYDNENYFIFITFQIISMHFREIRGHSV
jgi:hypothetical protein